MKIVKLRKLLLLVAICSLAISGKGPSAETGDFAAEMQKYLSADENVGKMGEALERYYTKKQREDQEKQAQAESKSMEDQYNNPVQVDIGSSPVKGSPDAPVTIVEFSDFQCPYCSQGAKTMDQVAKAYEGKVRIAFKNLALPFHNEARPAAIAALAAHQQGKFWEMHDKLFANQDKLGADFYTQAAKDLGLDMDKFNASLKDEKLAKQLDDDEALAAKLGVRGTPGFFVNGVQVKGARPFDYFKQVIDKWLAKAGK